MLRSGYSFKAATGKLDEVVSRVKEIGWKTLPITDRCSTFSFNRLTKLCEKAGLRPVYGVELGVVPALGEKRPTVDYWKFLAKDHLRPLHDLIAKATANPGREPSLLYSQALAADGLVKIAGERVLLDHVPGKTKDFYVGMSPATSKGLASAVMRRKIKMIAVPDNLYPRRDDLEMYRVMIGFRSTTQTYPQWIISDDEWREATRWVADEKTQAAAIKTRDAVLKSCRAELTEAKLFSPERKQTLRQMCVDGAKRFKVDLKDAVYSERLDKELKMIEDKEFEDYFYIVSDLVQWSKKRMIVGPGRGSSGGSLVCFLLGITAVDPIKYDLVFERFIDVTRADTPDIDIDFSDARRHLAFEHMEKTYGKDHVARLGTVSMFQSKSALNQIGAALQIPKWKIAKVSDSVIIRSKGDSRADLRIADTLTDSDAGKELIRDHPEAMIAGRMEAHPSNAGQHAAGIVITSTPVLDYVAVDSRTGATMCDWQDAKDLNLLKLDALGLTQLSVFERTLELAGLPVTSDFLEALPLDDPAAFDLLNQRKFSGIFQFTGPTLQQVAIEINTTEFEDLVAMTALCRPGPIGSGGTRSWINRKNGKEASDVPHPLLEPYTLASLGIMVYQEQIMRIGREVGDLSWADVTELRRSMGKSLGAEFFDQFGDRWKKGAVKKGVPKDITDKVWRDMCLFGMYCLSGETKLFNPYPNPSNPRTITLKKLYEQKGLNAKNPKLTNNKQKRFKLLCLQNGSLKPAPVVDVFYSGKRETWLVEVDSGESIRSTMDHRFLCSDMKYRPLKEIRSGDLVVVKGQRRYAKEKKGIGRGGQNWWPKFFAGEPLLKRQITKLKKIYSRCQVCKKGPYQITHHINEDHDDNRWENLQPVCRKCHQKIHCSKLIPNSLGHPIKMSRVVSISDPRVEDTYDVTMPTPYNNFLANGFVVHNSFNRSHSVAYALVSYYALWLKAHYPLEFAAATLDAEKDPGVQLAILREMKLEGVDYVPVDPDHSTDRWQVHGKRLIGPLTQIKGIGPAALRQVLDARQSGSEIKPSLRKKLASAKTEIDSLFPIGEAIARQHPDIRESKGIVTPPTPCVKIQPGIAGDNVIFALLKKLYPLDENEPGRVAKRGHAVSGPTKSVNFFMQDDTGDVFCKISRHDYSRLAPTILNDTRQGKSLFAVKGRCPPDFRMLWVKDIRYLGEIDK